MTVAQPSPSMGYVSTSTADRPSSAVVASYDKSTCYVT